MSKLLWEETCYKCDGEGVCYEHSCPHDEGMSIDSTFKCNCCAECEQSCARDL